MLSERIELLSHSSIREKIASFLITEYRLQGSPRLNFSYTRKTMAEILNIPRPSLSRELNNMKEDGIIDYEKNTIEILDLNLLESIIIEGA